MHRIGRTARAGRQGQSLLFLTHTERSYTAYLEGKAVEFEDETVIPTESTLSHEDLKKQVWDLMLADKDLVDKSQDAFVSFIRYYKEH